MALTQISTKGIKDGTITGTDLATNIGIGTASVPTGFKLAVNGDLSLGETGGSDNTFIDQKQNGHLEIINSGRDDNAAAIRINRMNNISGDTTYFRDVNIYDGKGASVMYVDGSATSVGIGTTSPSGGKLHIAHGNELGLYTSGPFNFQAKFESTDAEAAIVIEDVNSTTDYNRIGVIGNEMQFIVNNSPALHIDSSGRLLVGSTSLSNNGRIQGFIAHGSTAGESGIVSVDTTSMAEGVGGEISFMGKTNTSGEYNYVGHVRGIKENATSGNTACALTFHTRPTLTAPQERMRIDSSGNVGIGTISPSYKLHTVIGAGESNGVAFLNTNSQGLNIYTDTTANNADVFIDQGIANSSLFFAQAGTKRMTIDSSGNVGINTNGPNSRLNLNIGGDQNWFQIDKSRAANEAMLQLIHSAGNRSAAIRYANADNAWKVGIDGVESFTFANGATTTGDGTPRMRITSNGRLLVGTADESGKIHARTDVGSSSNFANNNAAIPAGDQYIHISNSNTGGNEQAGFVMNASGSASAIGAIYVHKTNSYLGSMVFRMRTNANTSASRMEIDSQGNIGAPNGTNIHNASDARVKKNVADLDKGLTAIKSLRPVSFNWIDGFCDKEKNTLYGFIAQEVETVDSNLIQQFGDGSVTVEGQTINDTLRVNEKFLIPMLVKAMQELSVKIETLETKVASLEAS